MRAQFSGLTCGRESEGARGRRSFRKRLNDVSTRMLTDEDLVPKLHIDAEIELSQIDDYLVDADVNSLYPAAIKNVYPVGVPQYLKPGSHSLAYFNELLESNSKCPEVGIYRLEYITNKNLIDGVLPRRQDGRLHHSRPKPV